MRWSSNVLRPLVVCGMEAAWIAQITGWMTSPPATGGVPSFSWPYVFALLLVASFSTRYLLTRDQNEEWAHRAIPLVAIASAVVAIRFWYYPHIAVYELAPFGQIFIEAAHTFTEAPQMTITFLVAAFAWYRGIGIARSQLTVDDVHDHFLAGIGALIVYAMLKIFWPGAREAATTDSAITVLSFFFFGLVGLALARLHVIQYSTRADATGTGGLTRQWSFLLIGVTMGVIAISSIAAGLVSPNFIRDLAASAGPLATIMGFAILLLSLPIFFLLELFINAVRWLLSLAGLHWEGPERPPEQQEERPPDDQIAQGIFPPEIVAAIRLVLICIVAFGVLMWLAKAVFHKWGNEDEDVDEQRDSVWSWDEAWAAFLASLRAFWNRWFGGPQTVITTIMGGREDIEAREPSIRTIRDAYRRFLRAAAQLGHVRQPQQTPYEFLASLSQAHPILWSPASVLTDLYVAARYNTSPLSESEVSAAKQAWESIHSLSAPPRNSV